MGEAVASDCDSVPPRRLIPAREQGLRAGVGAGAAERAAATGEVDAWKPAVTGDHDGLRAGPYAFAASRAAVEESRSVQPGEARYLDAHGVPPQSTSKQLPAT